MLSIQVARPSVPSIGRSRAGPHRLFPRGLASVLAFSVSGLAAAETSTGRLDWQVPEGCPGAAAVARHASSLLATAVELPSAEARVFRAADGTWQANMRIGTGERHLAGESCAALADAVAVLWALAAEAPPGEPEPASPVLPAPGSAPAPAPDSASAPAPGSALRISAAVLTEWGLLPGPAIGARLGIGLRRGPLAIELGVAALLPRRAELVAANAGADVHWWAGQLAGCHVLASRAWACAGMEAGQLAGTGQGVDQPETARGAWAALTAGLEWRDELGHEIPLAWQAGAGLALALVRPEFGFDDLGVLHRAGRASGRAFVGIGWR